MILNDFDNWLINENNYPKKSHYASNITSCKRQQYYQWLNIEQSNPNSAGSILKMKFGYATEDIFEKFLQYSIETKTKINNKILINYITGWKESYQIKGLEYPITCKLDFVLEFEDNSKVAVELKSMFGRGIVDIMKTQTPKSQYLDQIYIYIYLTPYKHFFHPYFGRDNGYRTEFEILECKEGLEVIYTTERGKQNKKTYRYNFDDLIENLVKIENSVHHDFLPERDYLVAIKNGEIKDQGFQYNNIKYTSNWQCTYCNWKNKCWENELKKYKNSNNHEIFKKEQ